MSSARDHHPSQSSTAFASTIRKLSFIAHRSCLALNDHNKITYLDDGELCVLTKDQVSFYDQKLNKINKKIQTMSENEVLVNIQPLNNMSSTDIESFLISEIDSRDSDSFSVTCNISNSAMDGL